jgi:tetratricopeptide (TPR) repeat protein
MTESKQMTPQHRAREFQRNGDLDGAVAVLKQAIRADETQLADLYGMLGGTLMRQRDLQGAIAAYDNGFVLEERSGAATTYNELNRVVVRVLHSPGLLAGTAAAAPFDVQAALARLEARLDRQVAVGGPRQGDAWALGDLAIVCALRGDADAARRSLVRLQDTHPAESVRSAYRHTLAALADLDTPAKQVFQELLAHL